MRLSEGFGVLDSLTITWDPRSVGKWAAKVALGKDYTLNLDKSGDKLTFEGLIVGLTHQRDPDNHLIVAQGVDKLFKLKNKYVTKMWDEVAPKDIVTQIASDHGLTGDYKGPTIAKGAWFQHNMTDAGFLLSLASRFECVVRVSEKKLVFARASVGGKAVKVQAWDNLASFEVSQGLDGMLNKVTVLGWDPEKDAQVKGESTGSALRKITGGTDTGPALFKSKAAGKAELVVDNAPFTLAASAKAHAEAIQQQAALGFLTAHATVVGEPTAVSGRKLEVAGLDELSGTYLITHSEHELNEHSGYVGHLTLAADGPPKGEK